MPYKFNAFTGNLDFYKNGVVTSSIPTVDNSIVRYDGITGQIIQDSKTLVQDGGAIEAQGFINNKIITNQVIVHSNQSMITDGFSIEGGDLIIEADAEVVII